MLSNESVGSLYLCGLDAINNDNILDLICSQYKNSTFAEASYAPTLEIEFISGVTCDFWLANSYWYEEKTGVFESGQRGLKIVSTSGTVKNVTLYEYGSSYKRGVGYTGGVCPVVKLKSNVKTSGKNTRGEWVLFPEV